MAFTQRDWSEWPLKGAKRLLRSVVHLKVCCVLKVFNVLHGAVTKDLRISPL